MPRWFASRMRPGRWSTLPTRVNGGYGYRGTGSGGFGRAFGSSLVRGAGRFASSLAEGALAFEAGRRAYGVAKRVYKTKYRKPDVKKYKQFFGKGAVVEEQSASHRRKRPWLDSFKIANAK